MFSSVEGAIIGFLVGLITGGLGAFKDARFEGFKWGVFWRSPIIATIYGIIGSNLFAQNGEILLLAGFAFMGDRITVESWKALGLRVPGKFAWGANRDRGWLQK